MKIAYLFGSLNRGGAETLFLDVFKNASNTVFKFIGIYRKTGVLLDEFISTRRSLYKLTPKFPFDPFYLIRLRYYLLKENVDIVHAQQYLDAIYAKIALLGTKVKIVQTYHGYDYGQSLIKDILIRVVINRIDLNIFVSKCQQDYFLRKTNLKKKKSIVVYNGISFDKLDISVERDDDVLKFGTVGNFVRGRDQMTICRFLRLIKEQRIDFSFYFVGKCNETEPWRYEQCVTYCKENNMMDCVHFLGSRNDVPVLLNSWDAFVYSTDHDTFGISVVEAIAVGIPVFVNEWQVMKEITDNGKYAILYRTKDEYDLLSKFNNFLLDKSSFKINAMQNKKEIRRLYSIQNYLNSLSVVYKNLLK